MMSEVKVTKAKATNKAAEGSEAVKPKKTATAPKVAGKASTSGAVKATKATAAASEAAKPKKTAVAKAEKPTTAKKAEGAKAPAKSAAAKPATTRKKVPVAKALVEKPNAPSQEERLRWIATAAYHRAEKRGFAPGYEMQDWFDAEAEIDVLIGKA